MTDPRPVDSASTTRRAARARFELVPGARERTFEKKARARAPRLGGEYPVLAFDEREKVVRRKTRDLAIAQPLDRGLDRFLIDGRIGRQRRDVDHLDRRSSRGRRGPRPREAAGKVWG